MRLTSRCRRLAALLAVMMALLPGWAAAADGHVIRIGILAFQGADRAERRWDSTVHHLAASLPDQSIHTQTFDLDGLTQAVRRGQVDFILTNPGQYVELESAFGVTRIATLAADGGQLASAVVVRANRQDLQHLGDLGHARIAAVAANAFGGFRVAWRELEERGIDPFSHPDRLHFVGFPIEKVIEAVAHGQADAGIARACLLEQMAAEGRIDLLDFRVLDGTIPANGRCRVSTRIYPDWPFAKLAHTPDALAKRVAVALLAQPDDDGTSWTVPVDYQPVHDLFRSLRIGPYEHLRHPSLSQTIQENRHWLAIAALALCWWLAHVVRVESLVRRRTQQLKSAHEDARRRREELEHAGRLAVMGEMASSLAHEINQPLAAIANYARGCQRRLAQGQDMDEVTEGLEAIAVQSERAAAMIRRIRSFVRKRPAESRLFDLNQAAAETLDLFESVAHRRNVLVTRDLFTPLPAIRGDRLQIEQVIMNLLQNAADAMENSPDRHLRLTTRDRDDRVELSVSDSGPGLSGDARSHLFEAFFTTKPDGLGLGLSLSRSIIDAHGGHLWADDTGGNGATFRFVLPTKPEERQ